MIARYFAYGSNMNPERVRDRGLEVVAAVSATLTGFRLVFNKTSNQHPGVGHANIELAHGERVEGVLYWLSGMDEIAKMDRFERTPINYSRDIVEVAVDGGHIATWTYFANPAVRARALKPPRSYLEHLLAGREYLSDHYYQRLCHVECDEHK